jgi:sulfatase maturation enzyme AslB (radical SAM superfamily)
MDGYTLFIKPTKKCNLNCEYCDLNSEEKHMSKEKALEIIDFVKKSDEDFNRILFTGGEPLLNYEIISLFAKEFPLVDLKIITNGTILNEGIKKLFKDNKKRLDIILSMDGPKEIQDKNRTNSFDDIMDNLSFFRDYIGRVNVVVTPETIFKLDKIIDFIKEEVYHGYDILIANGVDWDKELDWDKFEKYFKENCLKYTTLKETLQVEKTGLCECGDHLLIDHNGDIYPCMNYNYPGNKLGDIYNGIDENKRRPLKLARDYDFSTNFVCLLKNREANGSVFKEEVVHPGFFIKYLDLLRLIEGGFDG